MRGNGRGREECGEPGDERGDEGGHTNIEIAVGAFLVEPHSQAVAKDGSKGSVEESGPVAAELHAEATAGKTSADSDHPFTVVVWTVRNFFQFLAIFVE